jgi:hypothetical protein
MQTIVLEPLNSNAPVIILDGGLRGETGPLADADTLQTLADDALALAVAL